MLLEMNKPGYSGPMARVVEPAVFGCIEIVVVSNLAVWREINNRRKNFEVQ